MGPVFSANVAELLKSQIVMIKSKGFYTIGSLLSPIRNEVGQVLTAFSLLPAPDI